MAFSGPTNGVITQSGTDANLSGLSSIVGVTITDDDPTNGKKTYDMGDLRLNITGTLSHDPDREVMIFHHEKSSGSTSVIEPVLVISSNSTYNYGIKTTTSSGKIGYSSGCGLMFTGRPYSNWHPSDNAISVNTSTSRFVCRGGIIESSRGLNLAGDIDVEETIFLNSNDRFSMEIRTFGNGGITTDRAQNIVLAGGISILDAYRMSEQKIIFRNGAISRVYGDYYEAQLFDFDVSKNVFDYDIGNCANAGVQIADHHVVNSATGSSVRAMWRNTTGNDNQLGNTFVHKEVSFNIKDTNLTPIQNVKLYLQDNPSPYAKSISVTTTHATYTYPTPTLATAVVSNGGKTISYDYTGAIEYNKITDVNGNIPSFKVLTATQFLEYSTTDASATQYYVTFSGKWKEADGQEPVYSDWDTNRFGNFYKVDRRSNSNSSLDDFTFKFLGYNHLLSRATYPLKGIGELQIEWLLFDDNTITENDKSIVDAYTQLENPQKFYDRAKSYLYDNFAGENDVIVSRDGNVIDAGAYNVEIDATASSVFAFDGTTITIKSDNFIGQIVTTGTFTLLNGALYNSVPTYLDLTLQDGYISIYDNLGDIKYYTNQDQIISLPLNSTGTWTYKYAKYGFRIGEGSFVVNGTTIDISPKFTPDIYTSDVVTNVSAFTIFNNIQEIYNYLSYYSTTSAAMEYTEYYLYGNTLNLLTNNLVIDSNATKVFDYDGSTFTTKSNTLTSTLLFDTIQSSNVYLSGTSTVQNVEIDAAHLYNTNVVDLTGLTLKGTLVYNTDLPYSIFYTDCTIDKVINDPGTGAINITRINSIIYDTTDGEITTSVPISINITIPTDAYIAIYKPNGTRYYYGTGNQTLILGGADTATGTWSYTIAKYGYVKSLGTFEMDRDISSVTNINVASLNIDPSVTELNVLITSLYSNIDTTSKLYDYLYYFLTTDDGIVYNNSGAPIATKSIGSFTFDEDLTLDSDAIDVIDVTGNVFTFKSSGLDEDVTIYVNGDFNTLNSTVLNSNVKIRSNNLDSEIEFVSVDEITFYSTPTDRDNNTNPGVNLLSPTIFRFKFGSTYSGVLFSGFVYYRINVAGSVILGSTNIVQYNNILDLGTYGQLQQILNSQDVINRGIQKASVLIPHTIDI